MPCVRLTRPSGKRDGHLCQSPFDPTQRAHCTTQVHAFCVAVLAGGYSTASTVLRTEYEYDRCCFFSYSYSVPARRDGTRTRRFAAKMCGMVSPKGRLYHILLAACCRRFAAVRHLPAFPRTAARGYSRSSLRDFRIRFPQSLNLGVGDQGVAASCVRERFSCHSHYVAADDLANVVVRIAALHQAHSEQRPVGPGNTQSSLR
jgi:hypothetical protein